MSRGWHFIADDLGTRVGPEPPYTCLPQWRAWRDSGKEWIEAWDFSDVEAFLAKRPRTDTNRRDDGNG
jgi:hypothetical protein